MLNIRQTGYLKIQRAGIRRLILHCRTLNGMKDLGLMKEEDGVVALVSQNKN